MACSMLGKSGTYSPRWWFSWWFTMVQHSLKVKKNHPQTGYLNPDWWQKWYSNDFQKKIPTSFSSWWFQLFGKNTSQIVSSPFETTYSTLPPINIPKWKMVPIFRWVKKSLLLSHFPLDPWKLTCPLKRDYFSREYIFQPLIFRGHVSLQGGILAVPAPTAGTATVGSRPSTWQCIQWKRDLTDADKL